MNAKKEKWSHIAKEYVVSLFPNLGITNGFVNGVKVAVGQNLKFFSQKYENNTCQYLVKRSDYARVSKPFAEKLLANPDEFKIIKNSLIKYLKELVLYSKKINRTKLSDKKNSELFNLYQNFISKNFIVYSWGLSLVLLDFQETTYISDALSKYLKNELSNKDYSEYFTVLTTTPKRTEARQEEIDLLKIISKIKKNKKLANLFINNSEAEILKLLFKLNKIIYKLIERHVKHYNYITYVYEGPAMEINDFILMIKEAIIRGKDPDKKIKEILQAEKALLKKQFNYQNKLKSSAYYKKLIKLSQDVSFVKFYRREQQSHAYCLIEGLLKEIAKRLNISVKQLRFLLPLELKVCLMGGKEVDTDKNK
jgi:hypothetical protein